MFDLKVMVFFPYKYGYLNAMLYIFFPLHTPWYIEIHKNLAAFNSYNWSDVV